MLGEKNSHPHVFSKKWRLLLAASVLLVIPVSALRAQESTAESKSAAAGFSATDLASAQQFTQKLGIADWLGPLAPVALSPFFGIACLSGMALYGKGWVSADNAFLGENSPLNNPAVFWAFLILTIITSVPRLTKVSKPFAQAVDQVEAWAGIITMLALKVLMGAEVPETAEVASVHMGLGALTMDTLLMIAAAVNIFVINTVKFFFEVLIWITPIPTVDAIFEFANKTVCAALMAVYGYSPVIATGINFAIFVAAAFVFSWVYRREVFYRTMLIDACWAFFAPPNQASSSIVVFPSSQFGPFATRTRCRISTTDKGWTVTQQRLLRSDVMIELAKEDCLMELDAGYFTNSLKVTGSVPGILTFSRRFSGHLPELAVKLAATLNEQDAAAIADKSGLKAELA